MRLEALCDVLRNDGAEARGNQLRAFTPEDLVILEGALLAVMVVDSSLQVRGAAEQQLARRSRERRADAPAPKGPQTEADRASFVRAHAEDPAFLATALAYDRGRELLGLVDLGQTALDDALLDLALDSGPETVNAILRLPFDVSGRAVYLIDSLEAIEQDSREMVMRALAWIPLQERAVTDDVEVRRAGFALWLWVEGILADPSSAPTFAEFMASGGHMQRGVVGETADPLDSTTVEAMAQLTRCLWLALGPQRDTPQLDRAPFEADLSASLAELRVVAWRILLRNRLASPAEVLEALREEPSPGSQVELLRALPSEVPPGLGDDVVRYLDSPRASVRSAAIEVLARNPVLAAMACASLDPRATDAPLEVLAAQPQSLVGAAITAYLEVDREQVDLVRALSLMLDPPDPSWGRWDVLLGHSASAVRRAAATTALRAPPADGWDRYLPVVLTGSTVDALRWIRHFRLPGRHGDVAAALLHPEVGDESVREAVAVLRGYGDAAAWVVLAEFVKGSGSSRYGTRSSRGAAVEALLDLPEPSSSEAWAGSSVPSSLSQPAWASGSPREGLVRGLLEDRDPFQVELAVRYLSRRGVQGDWGLAIYDLTQEALTRLERSRASRRFRASWARFWRTLLPRRWISPGGRVRGGGAVLGLLRALLELSLCRGTGGVWADDLRPLINVDGRRELRPVAIKLYVALRGQASLPELIREGGDVAREAIRSGHPDQVEVEVVAGLDRLARGDWTQREHLAGWIEARPRLAYLPRLASFLSEGRLRSFAGRGLRVLSEIPNGRAPVVAALREECSAAVASRDDSRLRHALDLLEELESWALLPLVLPALAWAKETARQRLIDLLRSARARGVTLDDSAVGSLLTHHLGEVRVLALSLLRKVSDDPWRLLRPCGPGASSRPTDFAKPFLGVCEDHYADSMGLAIEGLLSHPNGQVARRALKLINRRQREIASLALFRHLEDPELRTQILTTFSTWSMRFVDPDGALSPELLEEERRKVRALLALLIDGPRSRAAESLAEAREHPVLFVRAAGLFAVGRLALDDDRGDLLTGLADDDPVLARCAAWAAGELAESEELDDALARLTHHRQPELRAAARAALIKRLDSERRATFEELLGDPEPEVRLEVLTAARARPEASAGLRLEARLGDPDPRVRELVLNALADRPSGEARALGASLRDPVPEVRLAALGVVKAWGDEALEQLRRQVGECVADPSIHVSGAALDLLGAPAGGGGFAAARDPVDEDEDPEAEADPPGASEGERDG